MLIVNSLRMVLGENQRDRNRIQSSSKKHLIPAEDQTSEEQFSHQRIW
jgi:hypothetical protein